MHEMTMLSSVTQIIAEEMEQHGLMRLSRVKLKSGTLAGLAGHVRMDEQIETGGWEEG